MSPDMFSHGLSRAMPAGAEAEPGKIAIRVKDLSERDRRGLLMHFLALDEHDRLLRFGALLSDEAVTKFVQRMNFARDSVFGVYDSQLKLVGVGHLAFTPRDALPAIHGATGKECVAEFGVSVSVSARGMGIGSKLFERAALHCRNADVDTLYVRNLSSNQTMMHIANKAGMEIHHEYGAADAYLRLGPADSSGIPQQRIDGQSAAFNGTFKADVRVAANWLENPSGDKPH